MGRLEDFGTDHYREYGPVSRRRESDEDCDDAEYERRLEERLQRDACDLESDDEDDTTDDDLETLLTPDGRPYP